MFRPIEQNAWLRCDQRASVVHAAGGPVEADVVRSALHRALEERSDVARMLGQRAGRARVGSGVGPTRQHFDVSAAPGAEDEVVLRVAGLGGGAFDASREALVGWADACPDGVAACDLDGHLLYVNPPLAALLGRPALGHMLGAQVAPGSGWAALWSELSAAGAWSGELSVQSELRGAVPVHVSLTRDDALDHYVLLVRDLRGMRLHARARASSSSVDLITRLAAGLAHDVNNLAAQIVGWSRRASASEDVAIWRQALGRQADLGRELGSVGWQLLGLTHTETLVVTADLAKVAHEVGWLLERLSNRVRVVEVVVPSGSEVGAGRSRTRLQIGIPHPLAVGVGLQLAIRALEGSPPDSAIEIGALGAADGRALLYVRYEAVAEERAEVRHLLVDGAVSGLIDPAVAARLQESGLQLTATEQPSGVELAFVGPRRFEAVRPSRATLPATGRRHGVALIVDDNPALRELMVEILKASFQDVRQAEDGVDALEQLDALGGAVDLVISDVMMPRMNGVQLTLAIRERYPSTPVFLTSGVSLSPSAQRAVPDVPFLRKPFELDELLQLLRQVSPPGAVDPSGSSR